MNGRAVIVGAGVAGLACAVNLAGRGVPVRVLEAANHAGGRCRSYFDEKLGLRIDNGNHILLSGNHAALGYLEAIGAGDTLAGPATAEFRFFDLPSGRRWCVRPNAGRLPWWIFAKARRVPGTRVVDYLKSIALAWAAPDRTVAEALQGTGRLYPAFWEPLAIAVLNTMPDESAASLLWPVIRETFGRGEQAMRPRIARIGLSESFVDPALAYLRERGAVVEFGRRVRGIAFEGAAVDHVDLGDERLSLEAGERLVLAVPPNGCRKLLPGISVPTDFRSIVNLHYRVDGGGRTPELVGVLGGIAQWIFRREQVISVTVSAAETLLDADSEVLARSVWEEVSAALDRTAATSPPPWRLVNEKRATFAQTPEQVRRRPPTRTRWPQVLLAGDWTATGLPATIEGAIRSGNNAAAAVVQDIVTP